MSAIRNLDKAPFDQLAAVVYDANLSVMYAGLIPLAVVQQLGRYRAHTNSHTIHFRRSVLAVDGVQDITECVRAAASAAPSLDRP